MAGSYQHCRAVGGAFRFDGIENMGDAHEACEMMYWMIHLLSSGDREIIRNAERAYFEMVRGERPWPVEPHNVTDD